MKYKLGIMTSTFEVQAPNADIAVAVVLLATQSQAPIVIYEPKHESSKFQASSLMTPECQQYFQDFLEKDETKELMRESYKTYKAN